MQNIKNFALVEGTVEQLESYAGESVLFLQSDDGQDWYECQGNFADDTVKIQYDSEGIIRAFVDAPVPQRGNVYAVSMLWPLNMSVAEIAVSDYPSGVTTDGTWRFDEAAQSVYQDADIVAANTLRDNSTLRNRYAAEAAVSIVAIQCSKSIGNARENDSDNLLQLQQYLDELRSVSLTTEPPAPPVFFA